MAHELLTAREARETAYGRQLGVCAACGTGLGLDFDAHHRQRRRALGWCPCNIVALHGLCHTVAPQAVHQRPEWARVRGLIVPTWDDPRETPLHDPLYGPVLLRCDGSTMGA